MEVTHCDTEDDAGLFDIVPFANRNEWSDNEGSGSDHTCQ